MIDPPPLPHPHPPLSACFAGVDLKVKLRILTGCYVLCESAYHDYYELAIEVYMLII